MKERQYERPEEEIGSDLIPPRPSAGESLREIVARIIHVDPRVVGIISGDNVIAVYLPNDLIEVYRDKVTKFLTEGGWCKNVRFL